MPSWTGYRHTAVYWKTLGEDGVCDPVWEDIEVSPHYSMTSLAPLSRTFKKY